MPKDSTPFGDIVEILRAVPFESKTPTSIWNLIPVISRSRDNRVQIYADSLGLSVASNKAQSVILLEFCAENLRS